MSFLISILKLGINLQDRATFVLNKNIYIFLMMLQTSCSTNNALSEGIEKCVFLLNIFGCVWNASARIVWVFPLSLSLSLLPTLSLFLSLSSLCLAYQKSNIQMQSPFVGPFPLWPVKVYTCRCLRFYLFYDFRKAQFVSSSLSPPLSLSLSVLFSSYFFGFAFWFLFFAILAASLLVMIRSMVYDNSLSAACHAWPMCVQLIRGRSCTYEA